MQLLSDPLGPEWEASGQIIEHLNRATGPEPVGSGADPICVRRLALNRSGQSQCEPNPEIRQLPITPGYGRQLWTPGSYVTIT